MRTAMVDAVVDQFRTRVRKTLGRAVVAIYWFGSRVRDEYDANSDYDLLLETEEELTEPQKDLVADIAVDIAADHGVLLDLHYRSAKVMRTSPHIFSPFIDEVLSEGVLV